MEGDNNFKKFFFISIYFISALFILLYFLLSFHSRLAGDDFFYLYLKNTFGAWDGMIYQYKAWSGRWSAHFIGCLLISSWKSALFLPLINFLTLILLYFSLSLSLRKILSLLKAEADKKIIFAFTIILISSFFFLSYNTGETWFWYIIIITYLWSIIGFFFLLNCLYAIRNSPLNYFAIIFLSAFIGGASESFALIFLTFLVFLLLFQNKIFKTDLNRLNSRIILSLIVLIISFSFSAFAPGTEIRHSLLPDTSVIDKVIVVCKSFVKFFIRFLPDKFPIIILFSAPWILFGNFYLRSFYSRDQVKKFLRKSTIAFIACLVIAFIPTSFIMSESGPDRALSIVSLITAIYFAFVFTAIGILIDLEKASIRIALSGLMFFTVIELVNIISVQSAIASNFSKACDDRLAKIENAKESNFTGVLELEKIPPAGMLYWDELSTDTSYFTNKHLREGLSLPFSVRLR